MLLLIGRLRVTKGHLNGLGLEQLDPLSADLAAWPIAPEHHVRRKITGRCIRTGGLDNRRIRSWCLNVRGRRRARPEHRAHPSWMDGLPTVFLALRRDLDMGDKRTDDQHRVPAVTHCAPAAVLAHTGSVPLDNTTCHRVAKRNPFRQILSCMRGAPIVQAHRMPGYRQTNGESRQREASGEEKDRSQRQTSAQIGEPNPWEEDHPREEAR